MSQQDRQATRQTTPLETLRAALAIARGDVTVLCRRLRVSKAQLQHQLAGRMQIPPAVYLRAADLLRFEAVRQGAL